MLYFHCHNATLQPTTHLLLGVLHHFAQVRKDGVALRAVRGVARVHVGRRDQLAELDRHDVGVCTAVALSSFWD